MERKPLDLILSAFCPYADLLSEHLARLIEGERAVHDRAKRERTDAKPACAE